MITTTKVSRHTAIITVTFRKHKEKEQDETKLVIKRAIKQACRYLREHETKKAKEQECKMLESKELV